MKIPPPSEESGRRITARDCRLTTRPPPNVRGRRDNLLLAAWLTREIPPRDYLLGNVFCTTSRWLIFGDTGVGKTLLALVDGGRDGGGARVPRLGGRRRARIMYLDGEMPAETFKERMQLIADSTARISRSTATTATFSAPDEMPPLNTRRARSGSCARSRPSSPT